MPELRRVIWTGFTGGWNPRNQPAEGYVWPRDLPEGQVLDSMGLEFSPGGILRWKRAQFKIHPPHSDILDNRMGVVKSLLEYRTDSDNQMLAWVRYKQNPTTWTSRLYVLETDWDALTTTSGVEWTYGHELFKTAVWAYEATSVSMREWGISDAAQLDDVLVICQYNGTTHDPPMRWDGTDLVAIGIAAPAAAPTASPDAAHPADLAAGTYSYYFTYTDGEFESMPSPIVDVVLADNESVDVAGLTDHASNYSKKLYRAYTSDTSPGARGANFFYVDTIADATTTYDDDTPQTDVGEAIAYDHALPPRGTIIEAHKDRLFMAGLSDGSSSYDGWNTGAWGNVLWWCEIQDPYSWPGDNQLEVGDDTRITNVLSWRDLLFITKESSSYVLEGAGESGYVLRQLSASVGCIAQNAAAAGPEGIVFAGNGAYWFWNGSQLRELFPFAPESAWGQWSSATVVRTVCYHDGRFYIMQNDYLLIWDPVRDVWTYQSVSLEDAAGYQTGLLAYNFSSKQTHILMRMQWADLTWPAASAGASYHQYITVFHPTYPFANADSDGTNGPAEYHAHIAVTLPPLIAPPGMTIQPLRVWVHGSWTTTGVASSLQPKLYVNTDGDYSNDCWPTVPACPSGGNMIGVPSGVHFGAASGYGAASNAYRSNISPIWYFQIYAYIAPDFELEAFEVEYAVMRARGA